jgi:Zn-finger nucleic acid-binding protein
VAIDARLCPTCRGPLTAKRVGPVEVETCTDCRALWLPPSVLERTVEVLDDTRTPGGLRFHEARLGTGPTIDARCPGDGTALRAAYWGDARLARCDACGGIWITNHMLATIRDQLTTAPETDSALWRWIQLLDMLPL